MNKKTWIFIGVIVAFVALLVIIYNVTKSDDLISKVKVVEEFDATIYDKKGERIETLTGYIGDIDKNSKKEITIEANEDLSKAYEINYTVRFNND